MQNIIVTTSDELRGLIGEAVRSILSEVLPHQQAALPETDEKLINEHEATEAGTTSLDIWRGDPLSPMDHPWQHLKQRILN